MQTEKQDSNGNKFEHEFGYVTSEGKLVQKDNRLFSGKTLEEGIEADFEDKIQPYLEDFEALKKTILEELESAGASMTAEKKEKLMEKLRNSTAIGDFNSLIDEIEKHKGAEAEEEEEAVSGSKSASDKKKPENTESAAEDEAEKKSADPEEETSVEAEVKEVKEKEKAAEAEEEKAEVPKAEETSAEETTETKKDEAEAEAGDEKSAESSEAEKEAEPAEEIDPDDPLAFYKNLAAKAGALKSEKDWKNAQNELNQFRDQWKEGPEVEDAAALDKLRAELDQVQEAIAEKKQAYIEQQQEKRENNMAYREQLLARMQKIVDDKSWKSQGEVNSIQRKFENVRPLPKEGIEEQEKKLKELVSVFDENRVQYLVDVRQKEEDNLTGKLITLEKIEKLVEDAGEKTEDWSAFGEELDKLVKQFRKIGKVPVERENEIWKRYNEAVSGVEVKRMEFDTAFKKKIDKNVKKAEKLIERAEGLADEEDLAKAARDINHLHNEWKKLSHLPHELNKELWQRFKTASDQFNQYRSENADVIKEQEQQNYAEKERLLAEARKMVEDEAWKGSQKRMKDLFDEWKKVGPVPRRKSDTIWKQFKKTMDEFYNQRRGYYKVVRKDQTENLKKKREIVEKIIELASAENLNDAQPEVKRLQDEYKNIGFVPIKQKDKIWKQYKEACDQFYNALRGEGGGRKGGGGGRETSAERQISGEIFKLRKEADAIRDQILKYSDTKTYFKPNKEGMKLINEIQENIDQAEKKLEAKNKRIEELQEQLRELDSEDS